MCCSWGAATCIRPRAVTHANDVIYVSAATNVSDVIYASDVTWQRLSAAFVADAEPPPR